MKTDPQFMPEKGQIELNAYNFMCMHALHNLHHTAKSGFSTVRQSLYSQNTYFEKSLLFTVIDVGYNEEEKYKYTK